MAGVVTEAWLSRQLAGAPDELVSRTREFIDAATAPLSAAVLAQVGQAALASALAAADRGAALDLLAADALVTLALAAKVEEAPESLGAFAAAVRAGESA